MSPKWCDSVADWEYISQCSSSTPASAFDAYWRVDASAAQEGWSVKEMFNEMKVAAGTGELQWKNAISFGWFMSQRFNGGLDCLPRMMKGRARTKTWYGFARVDDE
ncbi:hypothetical protein T492DRAFT_855820 [Pavlovales sp. CCMP2436]|nr:hypothetical protein T492DRAFT_855820 [Pavlovales sp. CCMP2436]